MKAEQIEKMRINSRRNGLNPKSWYHAGAEDMQEAMVEKACEVYKDVLMRHYGKTSYANMEDKMNILISKFKQAMED